MQEYFASKGGATAYVGSCVPGFPNLYILLGRCRIQIQLRSASVYYFLGPNVASGHASVIFSQEAQVSPTSA